MIYKIFYPPTALSNFIKYYWYMEDPMGNLEEKDLLIPDLSTELIFNFDSVYHRYSITEDSEENLNSSCLVGQRSKSIFANRQRKTKLFGIKFKPGALFTFFGIPEKEFKNRSISIEDLSSHSLMDLEEKVLNAKSIDFLPSLIDQYFLNILNNSDLLELDIFNHYLSEISKLTDVSQLERFRSEHDIHYKKLERLFAKYGGVSARNYIRINRFKNFYKAFNKGKQSFYNSSIYEFGYYDQNHFIKDFTFFTNQNPTQYYKLQSHLSDSILIQTLDYLRVRK